MHPTPPPPPHLPDGEGVPRFERHKLVQIEKHVEKGAGEGAGALEIQEGNGRGVLCV
jgi:hypothetical protein